MINNQNLAVLSEKVAHLESAVSNSTSASGISYDNTNSGLTADDVQAAIDEVSDNCELTPVTITGAGVDSGVTYARGIKKGDLVIVEIAFYDYTANDVACTIGEGFRPPRNFEAYQWLPTDASNFSTKIVSINATTGAVTCTGNIYRGTMFFVYSI